MSLPTHRPLRARTKTWERGLGALAVLTLIAAWFIGAARSGAKIAEFLPKALPQAQRFDPLRGDLYAGMVTTRTGDQTVGYVAVGEATGYGGPLRVAVGMDPSGQIVGVAVIDSKETPSYLQNVLNAPFVKGLLHKSPADAFVIGQDVDAVSGATYTSRAIADGVRQASRQIATQRLGQTFPADAAQQIQFGVPEIALVLLYAAGFIGHQRKFRYQKQLRWAALIGGLLVIGFLYNQPLTLSNINGFLLGYFPAWQSHLYWYMLLGGIVFVYSVDNKNPYCDWFCPFGAAQECIGVLGGARVWRPRLGARALLWLQRGLAWFAILVALLWRNPGISSFEVFGSLFHLTGSTSQFLVLGLILVLSLLVKRPWCNFLCPIHPVTDFIRLVRTWLLEVWQKIDIPSRIPR